MAVPKVWLNAAVSRDGRMAGPGGEPVLISSPEDIKRVHQMRAETDAILVGVGTVLRDDPSLRLKSGFATGDDPIRVVLDSRGRAPASARVFDGTAPTILLTLAMVNKFKGKGVRHARVPESPEGLDLPASLKLLGDAGITTLMVEGGQRVLQSFLAAGLWDKFTLYVSNEEFGHGGPRLWDDSMDELGLTGTSQPLGSGTVWTFSPK